MKIRALISYRVFIEIFSKILSVLSMTIVIRELGISGLGLIVFANTLAGFFYPLLTLGLASGIVRYFPPIRSSNVPQILLKRILLLVFVINFIFLVINYWAIPLFFQSQLGQFTNKSGITMLICLTILLFSFENLLLEYQRGIYELQRYLIFQTIQVTTLFSVSLLQTLLHLTLFNFLVVLLSVRFGILILFLLLTIMSSHPEVLSTTPILDETPKVTMQSLIKFGVPMSIAGLGTWLMSVSDRLVIAKGLDLEKLGVYGAINNITMIFPAITTGFYLLAYPSIIQSVSAGRHDLLIIMRTYSKLLSFLLIPVGTIIIVSGRFLLELLIPHTDSEMLVVYLICVVASALHQWNGLTYYFLAASNKVGAIRNTWILMGLLNLSANVICVSYFGLIGIAVVNLLTYVVLDIIFFLLTRRQLDTLSFYDWGAAARAICYCLVSMISAWLLAEVIYSRNPPVITVDILFVLIYSSIIFARHRVEISQALISFDLNKK